MSKKAVCLLILIVVSILLLVMNADDTTFRFFSASVRVRKAYVYIGFTMWGMFIGLFLR